MRRNLTEFGGNWTIEKLNILEYYLDAYTTALKNQPFQLVYIDAFAGSGKITVSDQSNDRFDMDQFVSGSAERALGIQGKKFDQLIFIDKSPKQCRRLEELRDQNPDRKIFVKISDANEFLSQFSYDWTAWRGVLFLDPFGTDVQWATIEKVASFNALDTWILFPTSAILRMLPTNRNPEDIPKAWAKCLTKVFGNNNWTQLYRQSRQTDLFKDETFVRESGKDSLLELYKQQLTDLFDNRFLKDSRTLRTLSNSPLFEFLFCAGSQRGARVAKRIAKHIITKM